MHFSRILEPTWIHFGSQVEPQERQSPRHFSKLRPGGVQEASKRCPRAPKSVPRAPQSNAKTPQERPKSDPREPQERPRSPRSVPRAAQERPQRSQDRPKNAPRAPRERLCKGAVFTKACLRFLCKILHLARCFAKTAKIAGARGRTAFLRAFFDIFSKSFTFESYVKNR